MSEAERFILDTHVWIWLIEDSGELSKPIIASLNQVAKSKQILIAAISLWEVSMLAEKSRIAIKQNAVTWLTQALQHPGITLCPLTPDIAAQSCNLPGAFHGDPADRMIVATACIENATIVTRDENILRYAQSGHVSCQAA